MYHIVWLAGVFFITSASYAADICWQNIGPGGGGRLTTITCDPRDPETIYAGCDVGGFYISRDAGHTWRIQNEGLNNYPVECIALSPTDDNILLLGMHGGVFKSTDQGKTWAWKRNGFPVPSRFVFSASIGALCFDPILPNVLYAGIGRPGSQLDGKGQIYKSEDCGETWKLVTAEGAFDRKAIVNDLKASPDGAYILAATSKGIYRSGDHGKTWSSCNQGLDHTDVLKIAIAHSDPRIVYCTLLTTSRDASPWNGGVWRSEDGGKTWGRRSCGLAQAVGKKNESALMTSNYKEIAVHPQHPDIVYVGDRAWVSGGVYSTVDGGQNWQWISQPHGVKTNMELGWCPEGAPNVTCLAISPLKPDRIIFGTFMSIYLSDSAGRDWQQRYCRRIDEDHFCGNGLETTCFNNIVLDGKNPGRLYFCYYDIGLWRSDNYGRSFRKSAKGMKNPGHCFTVAVDPDDKNIIWAATGGWATNVGDVCRSMDQGHTWTVVGKPESGLPVGQTKHLLLDPSSPANRRILYVTSNNNGVFRSEDSGDSWRSINTGLPETALKKPQGLLIDPGNSKHLYLALGGSPQKGSGIYETLDAGMSWRKKSHAHVFASIEDFQADPCDFSTLYVCQSAFFDPSTQPPTDLKGGLFKSIDGGISWEQIYNFRRTSSVAVSPTNRNILYVGTSGAPYHDAYSGEGVVKTVDGGKTWHREVDGLTCLNVSCIRIDPTDPSRLYVGTGGNGAFGGVDQAVQKE